MEEVTAELPADPVGLFRPLETTDGMWDLRNNPYRKGPLGTYANSIVEQEFVRFGYQYFTNLDRTAEVFITVLMIVSMVLVDSQNLRIVLGLGSGLLIILLSVDVVVCRMLVALHRSPAIVHEGLISVSLFLQLSIISFACVATEKSCLEGVKVVGYSTTAEERRNICIRSFYPYPFAFMGFAIMCGRPRAYLTIPSSLSYVALVTILRAFGGPDTAEEVCIKVVMDVVAAISTFALHFTLEQVQRDGFEEYVEAYLRMQQASKMKEVTETYLGQLLPPMLYSRLLSQENYEDYGSSVTVFIAAVSDLGVPVSAHPDTIAAAIQNLSELMAALEGDRKRLGVERVRVSADEYIATSNLIVPTLTHALRIACFANKAQLHIHRWAVDVRCAVHTGAVRGNVVGTRFLRYDVHGDGIDTARDMLGLCGEGEVVVSSATQQLLRDRAELDLCERSLIPRDGGAPLDIFLLRGVIRIRVKPPAPSSNPLQVVPQPTDDRASPPADIFNHVAGSSDSSTHRVRFDEATSSSLAPAAQPQVPLHHQAQEGVLSDMDEEDERPFAGELSKRLRDARESLAIVSRCFFYAHFAGPETEASYRPLPSRKKLLTSGSVTVLLSATMTVILTVELRGLQLHGRAAVGQHLLIGSTVYSCLPLALLYFNEEKDMLWLRFPLLFLGMSSTVLILVGVALSHPSFVSNDIAYFFILFGNTFCLVFAGFPWHRASLEASLFLLCGFVLFVLVGNGILKVMAVLFVVACLLLWTVLFHWLDVFARQRFSDTCLVDVSREVEQQEKEILQSALVAVVPLPLLDRVLNAPVGGLRNGIMEHVSTGVVVQLYFVHGVCSPPTEDLAPSLPVGAMNFDLAEKYLKSLRSLSLTKVFGDSAFAAGPLDSNSEELRAAATEALSLIQAVASMCSGAVTLGSFYAVVTGGTHQVTFFLVGDAVRSGKLLARGSSLGCIQRSEEFIAFCSSTGVKTCL